VQVKGWFEIPGVQEGDRTLADQMKGLAAAMEASRGKRVIDLGCAEGLIAIEFARAGASHVTGLELNPPLLEAAQRLRDALPPEERQRLYFHRDDVSEWSRRHRRGEFDVVLALAIIHKLAEPTRALRACAESAKELVVIRLPKGSKGVFATKHHNSYCDVNATMPRHGFRLDRSEPGPHGEIVQYWRRR
jgi:SAM-dependent methyltransferase